ncbi:MAG TPA: hypothetical protein VNB94_13240 [Mycobacteriales bacterium]|nr:hypothetical protein [Mycobacteriales bacterium]
MRVYVATTLAGLQELIDTGVVPADGRMHGVTPALRESFAEADAEELEYAALTAAARDSLHALAANADAPRRRVVIAAEVPERAATPTNESPSRVTVSASLGRSDVAAVHVDDVAATETIAAAVGALADAESGDDEASAVVEDAAGWELMWFATQEIEDLLT